MTRSRSRVLIWSLLALAVGAFLALIISGSGFGPEHALVFAVLLPVVFIGVLSLSPVGWRLAFDNPPQPRDSSASQASPRAPPA